MKSNDKAVAACLELYMARQEVRHLGGVIGAALQACLEKNDPVDTGFWTPPKPDFKTHLARAYEFEVDTEAAHYGQDGRCFLEPEEQQAILAECEHCMAAHNAIQARKAAKQRLGKARRLVTLIGKAAAKESGNA